MFEQFWRGFGLPSFRRMSEPEGGFNFAAPAIDFAEDEKAYHLAAELPGLSENDINLTVSGDRLTITGEKREESEKKEELSLFGTTVRLVPPRPPTAAAHRPR